MVLVVEEELVFEKVELLVVDEVDELDVVVEGVVPVGLVEIVVDGVV